MTELRRVIGLPTLVLFGVGTMLGGGFYALLGRVVAEAGVLAPLAFLAADLLALVSALSFGEMAARFPVSAGEVRFVEEGVTPRGLPALTGWLVITTGVVSAATLSRATAGFLHDLVGLPTAPGVVLVVAGLGVVAIAGVGASTRVDVAITLVEVATLLVVAGLGLPDLPDLAARDLPEPSGATGAAVFAGAFLAFYAFVGFEDMVNMAEEVRRPRRVMPRAILLSLVIATGLYVVTSAVAVATVPLERLAASDTPVAELVGGGTGTGAVVVGIVSLLTGANGALVQVMMASRVAYQPVVEVLSCRTVSIAS